MGGKAGWLVGLVAAALVFGAGGAPVRAATTPPTLKIEVIGQGTVTGLGISCGLGALTCYSAYGADPTSVTLHAVAASGWTLSAWKDEASACAAPADCPLSVTGDMTATAVFTFSGTVQTSTLSVSATNGEVTNGSGAGNYPIDCDPSATPATTACSLTVLAGSTLTMTETPNAGYLFTGWGGACSGTGPSCAVYLPSSKSVGAAFAAATSNTLTATVNGNGSVSGGGISCGAGSTCSAPEPSTATVTLTASPASGYVLTAWSGGCTGTQSTCTVQMTAAVSVTATFAPMATLSVTVNGNGFVTGGGIGCDGGQTCTAGELPNTSVTLTAHPNAGGGVIWSGCTSTSGLFCTVTVGATVASVTATFAGGTAPPVATDSLTITVKGDGYVVSTSASIYCTAAGGPGCTTSVAANTTVTLSAISASGNSADFTHWLGDCSAFTSTSCTLTMNSTKTAEADFAGGNTTYLLTAQAVGSGTISGAGLRCTAAGGSGCSSPQAAGATVTLAAAPGFGATFSGWGGACTGTSSTCSVAMATAASVTATFSTAGAATQTLAVVVAGAGTVSWPGGECAGTSRKDKTCTPSFATGKTVTLTAKPDAGFALSGWTGACSGARATCTVAMSSAKTVGATFARPALAATRKPSVVKTAAGYRVTLWFRTTLRGSVRVVAELSGRTAARQTKPVRPGGRRIMVTVSRRGRYVFTLTLAGHALRWRVRV